MKTQRDQLRDLLIDYKKMKPNWFYKREQNKGIENENYSINRCHIRICPNFIFS